MAKYKLNPLLKHGFDQSGGIEIEEIHGSDINIEELNNLKNTTGNIQSQLNVISAKLKSGKAIDITNKDINVKYDDESIKLDKQGRLYAVPFDPTELQNSINDIKTKVNAFFDVDVRTWDEFKAAVALSLEYAIRIHFRADITVTSTETLDISNCVIYGHYKKWIVNGHTTRLSGDFGWFDNVWFEGSKNYPLFKLIGPTAADSCTFYFQYCRIYKWLGSGNAVFIEVAAQNNGTSIHTVMNMCTINDETFTAHPNDILMWKHTSGICMSLKIAEMLYSGHNSETKTVGFTGTSNSNDLFIADGSVIYKQPSGGYTPSRFFQWGVVIDQTLYWDEY